MTELAIKTEGLGKSYVLGLHQGGNLRETVTHAFKHPLQTLRRKERAKGDVLWALKDLSIEIEEGDVVGLIGHNGAGKSTVLKILSRVTEPSSGWAEVRGRVGSLLEVGTGFHPELTGRENIFLNGSILGMRRNEIRSRFDAIVEFADVARFLDTPVKRYSSGMQVRLAFAVAAHLEPEILLVDEVLAVGDSAFQRRSLAKMTEVAKEGRTVVFVSHNLAIIRALCQRGVLLERGEMITQGDIGEVLDRYLEGIESAATKDLLDRTDRDGEGVRESLISRVDVHDLARGKEDVIVGGNAMRVTIAYTERLPEMHGGIAIVNSLGVPVAGFDSRIVATEDTRSGDLVNELYCDIDSLPLVPGRYRLDVDIRAKQQYQDGLVGAAFFDVEPGVLKGRPMPPAARATGSVVLPHSWRLPE